MERYRPSWYEDLTTPWTQKPFTEEHIMKIEKRIKAGKNKRRRAIAAGSSAAVILCIAAVVWWVQLQKMDDAVLTVPPSEIEHDKREDAETGNSQEDGSAGESDDHDDADDNEGLEEGALRLRTSAIAFEGLLNTIWGYGVYESFTLPADQEYRLLEDPGGLFVKIGDGEREYWVNRWYIADERDSEPVELVVPYEMIVFEPTVVYAYPDMGAPTDGSELDMGRVVQVEKRYKDWVAVNFKLYAEPMIGDKWIRADALIAYDDKLANEGYLQIGWEGSYVYDMATLEPKELVDRIMPVTVTGEKDGMYIAQGPGGISGLVRKDEFIPNPFAAGDQRTYMGLSPDAKRAFERFKETRDDEELRTRTPLDIYQMYHHAIMKEDPELLYDLYGTEDSEGMPDRETFLADWGQKGLEDIRRMKEEVIELSQIVAEGVLIPPIEDRAYILLEDRKWSSLVFALHRTEEGVWKVSWDPWREERIIEETIREIGLKMEKERMLEYKENEQKLD